MTKWRDGLSDWASPSLPRLIQPSPSNMHGLLLPAPSLLCLQRFFLSTTSSSSGLSSLTSSKSLVKAQFSYCRHQSLNYSVCVAQSDSSWSCSVFGVDAGLITDVSKYLHLLFVHPSLIKVFHKMRKPYKLHLLSTIEFFLNECRLEDDFSLQ